MVILLSKTKMVPQGDRRAKLLTVSLKQLGEESRRGRLKSQRGYAKAMNRPSNPKQLSVVSLTAK